VREHFGIFGGVPKATEAAAPEATEAATAAPRRIAGTPTHGYAATREAAKAASIRLSLGSPTAAAPWRSLPQVSTGE
jgi:hypothetical protein